MSSQLDLVLASLKNGRFILNVHARKRMRERGVYFEDIVSCAQTLKQVREQENGTLKIEGEDLDGDDLTVIAAYDGETVVVTLF
jgi:hypothetical protein